MHRLRLGVGLGLQRWNQRRGGAQPERKRRVLCGGVAGRLCGSFGVDGTSGFAVAAGLLDDVGEFMGDQTLSVAAARPEFAAIEKDIGSDSGSASTETVGVGCGSAICMDSNRGEIVTKHLVHAEASGWRQMLPAVVPRRLKRANRLVITI